MRALILLLVTLLAGPALAQQGQTDVFVGGVTGTSSGDDGRRDDHEGFRNGLVAALTHRSDDVMLALRFEPTTAGWVDLITRGSGRLRFALHLDRSRRYSDTSIRPEITSAGTPVSQLYPYSNTLAPAFGDSNAVTSRNRLAARLSYRLDHGVVDLSLSGLDLSGTRTPEAGGIAFGDSGMQAFFTPGLERHDTEAWQLGLGVRLQALGLFWRGGVSAGHSSSDTTTTFPTYGRAQLLDLSSFTERHDVDSVAASLTAAIERPSLSAVAGVALAKSTSTPSFSGGVLGAAPSDSLRGGSSEVKDRSVAAGLLWRPSGAWSARLAGRSGWQSRDGGGTEQLRGRSLALDQHTDTDTWRVESDVRMSLASFTALLGGGRERDDIAIFLSRGDSLQTQDDAVTRDRAHAEATWRVGHDARVRIFGERRWRDVRVDLRELFSGYALTDRKTTIDMFGASFGGRVASMPVSLAILDASGTTDLDPPSFDPIYDPSWTLTSARVKTRSRSFLAHLASPGGDTFELWGEAGWREQRWELLETVTFPGFVNGNEEVRGWTGALGFDWKPAPAWKVSASGWIDAPSRTVDNRTQRAEATVERGLGARFTAVAQISYRRFDERLYQLDDYTLTAFSVGVRGRL